ncbi:MULTISPECIES: ArsB/NhaD family transporter [unclassified Dehalobacter]|uniref:SLC13 family permease n=1 Tax=unclassified Dehalobacter TaxID=2635733 RepID=UPI000377EF79|nr:MULTISPECIES: ArsB/NhaD family transporter [unclassified Dehalobacter]RJE48799.1 hypothetical protein A7K50_08580 [Dehalobacter sp. MCB1]TCX51890.1 hypothetical protein C1I36_06105 [Dehalobacter sp. 14DCB1]TCX52950.1 hypothetical protein C1I38_07785 [Dehalobacter sp. 12DCB1]
MTLILTLVIFVATYALIVTEKIPRAVTAALGACLLILLGVFPQKTAVEHIDWNTLGLLIGMMIIVDLTRRSGVFGFLAIWVAKKVKGNPIRLLISLAILTAILSAFLDNVTTVLLIVPVSIVIAETLKLNPMPFLITQILASNIGGTATLIGDPPNIMIAGPAELTFMDFMVNLTPVTIVILAVTLLGFYFLYRKKLKTDQESIALLLSQNEYDYIKDWAQLKRSLAVLALTIVGFMLHAVIHVETATIALAGGMLLMVLSREEPEEVFLAIEWPTIFFFTGLFVLVGGLVEVGVLDKIAEWSLGLTGGVPVVMAMLIVWLSAIFSAFVDNIPFVATMIPLIQKIGVLGGLTPEQLQPLWWSLALGACLGGNGTIVGASANVIVSGIAEKNGYPISYKKYFLIGFPFMLLSIVIASAYILLRYY